MAGTPTRNHSLSKDGGQRSHFYVWDQVWARWARVKMVVDAAAQLLEMVLRVSKTEPTKKEIWCAQIRRRKQLVVCDESGHTKFPFSFAILSWGELG